METGYLTDDEGNPSSMRLMSVISLGAAVILAGMAVWKDCAQTDVMQYVFLFLLGAFAPKTIQKQMEKRVEASTK